MELPISILEFDEGQAKRADGMLIGRAFPTLNHDQKEFIMTGITPDQWDKMTGGDN